MNDEPKNPAKIVDSSMIDDLPVVGGVEVDENGQQWLRPAPENGTVEL